ncbi:MAG: class I SAM-dependent methyltransferase [Chloroflexota bacterium]
MAGHSAGPILELGCGTGRVLFPLAQVAPPVYGLDRDISMLAFLNQQIPAALRANIHIFSADFANFHLSIRFGLILLPCNTYSTLAASLRQATLENVRRHLLSNGLFAVSLPNPDLLRRLPAHADPEVEEVFPHPNTGEPVQVVSSWRRTRQHFVVDWHYDHLLPDGQVQRLSAQVQHVLLSTQEILQEIHSAGFSAIICYGDYDGSPHTTHSPSLIILAS